MAQFINTREDVVTEAIDGVLALSGGALTRLDGYPHIRVVLRSDGTSTVEIAEADPAGTIREISVFAPAINYSGLVAFRAKDAGGDAIYVGDGKTLTRVVGNGDVVATDRGPAQIGQDNATDPAFSGQPAINARGDVAFVAGLYPEGDNQTEWGSGVFVRYAVPVVDDRVFANGFEEI